MAIKGLDHMVIRVKDLDAAIENYKNMGMECSKTLETPGIGKQAILRFPNGTFIELVSPTDPESPIAKAIEARGEGFHSMVMKVDDLDETVQSMKEGGATVIQQPGMDHSAFVHPKSSHGVLLQMQRENL
jgi:methylmalonyl-CoA epimerase